MPKKLEDARLNWMYRARKYCDLGWVKHVDTIYQGGGVTIYYFKAGPKFQYDVRLKFTKIKDRQAYKKEWLCTCRHCNYQGYEHNIMCSHILACLMLMGELLVRKHGL